MRFGNFEVLTDSSGKNSLLGGGAFGKTYKARHLFLKRIVALKVLHDRYANDPRARERFLREAQAAHELKHQNIAEVLDFGESDGSLYYAMEFCSGGDLEHYIRKRAPIPPVTAVDFSRQICRALAYAHDRSFYHRDLKPPNVMLASAEGDPVLKLIDFGLVKMGLAEEDTDAGLTMAGEVLGTPMFASPEQLREENLDHRSDLFSLGMTLWYLLEGAPPVPGSAITVMAERLSEKTYDKLFSIRVPGVVRPVLARLLEKDPARRYQNASAVLAALTELSESLSQGKAKEVRNALTPDPSDSVIQEAGEPGMGEILALAGNAPETSGSEGSVNALPMIGGGSEPAPTQSAEPAPRIPRLQLLRALGDCVLGEAKLAEDRLTQSEVLAVRLQDELASTETWPARLAGTSPTLPPRLTADLPLVTQIIDDIPYAVCPCPESVRLVQILQSRGPLPFLEACQVLSQIALIMDEARTRGERYDLQLNQIHVAPLYMELKEALPAANLVKVFLDQWPPFLVCVPVRQAQGGMPGHMEDGDDFGMMTMRSATVDEFLSPNAAFAGLIFRLITGGEPRPAVYRSKNNYRPIPNLSREGNQLLATCLEGGCDSEPLSHVLDRMLKAEKSSMPAASSTKSTAGSLLPPALKTSLQSQPLPSADKSSSSAIQSSPKAEKLASSSSSSGALAGRGNAQGATPPPLPKSNPPQQARIQQPQPQPQQRPQPQPQPQPTPQGKKGGPMPQPAPPKPPKKEKPHDAKPTPPVKPPAPKAQPIPTAVLFSAFASVVILATVIGIAIYIFGDSSTNPVSDGPVAESNTTPASTTPTQNSAPVQPPSPVPSGTDAPRTPEPPVSPPPPLPEPKKVEPPKPKPPRQIVFTKGVTPATALVKVNETLAKLTRNASNQLVLNLEGVTEYPISIRVSAPPGYNGEAFLIVDPKDSNYDRPITFNRTLSLLTVPGNADYEKVEMTFLGPHPDEAPSLVGEPDSSPPVKTESLSNDSAQVLVPTGRYRVRLVSSRSGIEPRTLAEEYPVPAPAGTRALQAPPAWTGSYECQFSVPNIRPVCQRVFHFRPGLTSAQMVEDWLGGAPVKTERYTITDIKIDANGVLTAHLPLQDPKARTSFDETFTMTRQADGSIAFDFVPAAGSGKNKDDFHIHGKIRRLSGTP